MHLVKYVKRHYFEGSSNEFAKVSISIIRILLATLATVALSAILNMYMRLDFSISLTLCTLLFLFFQDCVFLGAGGPSLTEYQSVIFYHNSSPKWNETIKVQCYADCHAVGVGVLTSAVEVRWSHG